MDYLTIQEAELVELLRENEQFRRDVIELLAQFTKREKTDANQHKIQS